ncbi:4-hydroxy-tetrahydrodipicolinate synthase [Rhodoligotrophos appendicifer]|uniref:dihydrodipicolinate synthase family protein n=1 Tax=Rhodoligotrophos appendicifer TaxID=987056 RepID=UPI0011858045|nr:dihydrodipicolinate synthase family protein [Rhodoligotrophos appendicifer]
MKKITGVIAATVTPFDLSGDINFYVYDALLDHIASQGVKAIVPASLTGEFFSLTFEERTDLMRFAARHRQAETVLIASTISMKPAETLSLCKLAEELDYAALIVAPPAFCAPSRDEIVAYYRWIDQNVGLPIIIYNFPSRLNADVDLQVLQALAGCRNLIAYKDTSGDIDRMHQVILCPDPQLELVCGLDALALESYAWGAKAILGGAACFLGRQHNRLFATCVEERDFAAGKDQLRAMLPLVSLMDQGGKYVQMCRLGCELAGIPVGDARKPLLPLSGQQKYEFMKAFAAATGNVDGQLLETFERDRPDRAPGAAAD